MLTRRRLVSFSAATATIAAMTIVGLGGTAGAAASPPSYVPLAGSVTPFTSQVRATAGNDPAMRRLLLAVVLVLLHEGLSVGELDVFIIIIIITCEQSFAAAVLIHGAGTTRHEYVDVLVRKGRRRRRRGVRRAGT